MNRFPITAVIAACDSYLLVGSTITERFRVTAANRLRSYADALRQNDKMGDVNNPFKGTMVLTIEEFEPIMGHYKYPL